jgi:hypothetical protein
VDEGEIFSRRTAAWLAGISAVSLAATLVLLAFSGRMRAGDSPQADAFSRSSIGYRALVELLEAEGVDVVISRFRSAEKAGARAPLLVAEPLALDPDLRAEPGSEDPDEDPIGRGQGLGGLITAAEIRGAPVIVVLPKHDGDPSADRDGWIGALGSRPDGAERALELIAGPGCVVAWPEEATSWSSALPGGDRPTLAAPQLITAPSAPNPMLHDGAPGRLTAPSAPNPGCDLDPLVWSEAGALVAQLPGSDVYVIADPDLLNTWGMAHGRNAVIAHRLIVDRLGATSLVVDGVLRGFFQPPSIWTELLTLPLLPITLHVVGLTLLALAAAAIRFGKPLRLPPRVPPGKRALVDSTAELLDGGGHHAESVRHYLRMSLRHTAAALGLAAEADPLAALASLARARGVRADIAAIAGQVEALPSPRSGASRTPARPAPLRPRTPARGRRIAARALALAAAIDGWRKEMLHGDR